MYYQLRELQWKKIYLSNLVSIAMKISYELPRGKRGFDKALSLQEK
jgi:hypothetical protein